MWVGGGVAPVIKEEFHKEWWIYEGALTLLISKGYFLHLKTDCSCSAYTCTQIHMHVCVCACIYSPSQLLHTQYFN